VTSADLGLLVLADGHRTVREIAERVNSNPMDVARHLARFRLAGVLELVAPPVSRVKSEKSAMAAADRRARRDGRFSREGTQRAQKELSAVSQPLCVLCVPLRLMNPWSKWSIHCRQIVLFLV